MRWVELRSIVHNLMPRSNRSLRLNGAGKAKYSYPRRETNTPRRAELRLGVDGRIEKWSFCALSRVVHEVARGTEASFSFITGRPSPATTLPGNSKRRAAVGRS